MDELTLLENSSDASQRLSAVERLVKNKSLNRLSKDQRFIAVLDLFSADLRSTDPEQVWSAAAAIARIAAGARALSTTLRDLLAANLLEKPAYSPRFEDVDNRKYAVAAVRMARGGWRGSFFATIASTEESAESVREEAILGLLEATPDVASAAEAITAALGGVRYETSDAASSTAKRLRRILKALRDAWAVGAQEPGDRIGLALALLVEQPFRRTGPPPGELREELASLIASNVHQAVRARFSYANDPRTYECLDVVRRWADEREWNEWTADSPAFVDLRTDICEALRMLTRAGTTDDRLLRNLELAAGSADAALALRRAVAFSLPDPSSEAAQWLQGRQPASRSSQLAEESRLRDVDAAIAPALIRTQEAGLQPSQATVKELFQAIASASSIRGLTLFGVPGERLEYSPLRHALDGGHRAGVRFVRVLQPGVETVAPGVQPRVVRKALVAALAEGVTE